MAKVFLTTTPWQPFHTLRSLFPNIPPLGLQILSAALKAAGHETFIADVQHLPPLHPEFVKMVEGFGPDVIVFTNNCMANTPVILRVAKELRSLFGGVKLTVGGQVPSFRPEYFLAGESPAFDAAGLFEGEQVIAPLVEALMGDRPLAEVKGAAHLDPGGKVVRNPLPEPFPSADDYPFPDWEGSLKKAAFSDGLSAALETSRGCPHGCTFCSIGGYFGARPRHKSVDRVMEEISRLAALGVTEVYLIDDSFGTDPDIAAGIFEGIAARFPGLKCGIQIRADIVARNPGLIELGEQAGLFAAVVGFEGYSSASLETAAKGNTAEINRAASDILRSHGVMVYGTHIFGGPGTSFKDYLATFRQGRRNSDVFRMTIYTPLLGSPLFDSLEEGGKIRTHDPREYYYGTYVISDEHSPAAIKAGYFGLQLLHYFLPGTMLKALASPNRVTRKFNRRAYRGAYDFVMGQLSAALSGRKPRA